MLFRIMLWRGKELPARPQFQAFKPSGHVQADLALNAQRLQRDRIVRTADQHITAQADPDRCAALRAGGGRSPPHVPLYATTSHIAPKKRGPLSQGLPVVARRLCSAIMVVMRATVHVPAAMRG